MSPRPAFRRLARSPGFTATVAATLAVGIGLATAVFTVANAVLIRRLPVQDQDRLVVLYGETGDGRYSNFALSVPEFRDFTARTRALGATAHFAYYGAAQHTLKDGANVTRLRRAMVSGNFFDLLGARAAIGRALGPDDDVVGAAPAIVLSHRAWLQRFGGDSGVVGRTVSVLETGRSARVVGVMPAGLDYPGRADFWAPLTATSTGTSDSLHVTSPMLDVIGRLRPGAQADDARAELSALFARPDANPMERGVHGVVHSLPDLVLGDTKPAVLVLGAVAALLLLLACVNVANLLLVRGLDRAREIVVRTALGASRGNIVRELLAESALLSMLGGAGGVAVAVGAVRAFQAFAPPGVPRLDEISADRGMLGVATVIGVVALTIFSLAPALITSRVDAGQVLRSGGRQRAGGRGIRAANDWLVVTQVAFATVVLATAALTVRSVLQLQSVDLALEPRHLVVAEFSMPGDQFPTVAQHRAVFDALGARINALPGVEAVTPVLSVPFAGMGFGVRGKLQTPGEAPERAASSPILNFEAIAPNYFATLETPLTLGRAFNDADRAGAPSVVIVSHAAAAYFWPGENPLGRTLSWGGKDATAFTVVGVVADTRYRELEVARPSVYFPMLQSAFPLPPTALLIRTAAREADLVPAIRAATAGVTRDVALVSALPFETLLDGPEAQPRMVAALLATFASAALLLAAVGLFGVIAELLRRRAREFGIRMALGATAGMVSRSIVGRGVALAALGAMIGIPASYAIARTMRALLFEVRPSDPATLVIVIAILLIVAAVASAIPAIRGGRIDPATALRADA